MSKERIFLSCPHMSGKEMDYIKEAFDINWVAPLGPHLEKFEEDLKSFHGCKDAVLMNSGTSCIHIALKLIDFQDGDTVFCASGTFIATANPVVYERGKLVFIDSEPETWNMSPQALKRALEDYQKKGQLPKAVLVVHLYGYPAKMDELTEICNSYGVPIIEDAAEALGSRYKEKPCGTLSEFGILSFNGNKIITTSGGGALLLNNLSYAAKSRFLITQARDKALHYQHSSVGYNYRLSNILAGIGIAQLEVLPDRVKRRRAIFKKYTQELPADKFEYIPDREGFESNRWLSTFLLKDSSISPVDIINKLEESNIEARPLWKPLHLQPVFNSPVFYKHDEDSKAVCEDLFERGLCLPSSSNMTDKQLDFVIQKIKEAL